MLVGSKFGAADQLIRGCPPTRVDDAFAQHGEERVRIQLINLSAAERARRSDKLSSSHEFRLL